MEFPDAHSSVVGINGEIEGSLFGWDDGECPSVPEWTPSNAFTTNQTLQSFPPLPSVFESDGTCAPSFKHPHEHSLPPLAEGLLNFSKVESGSPWSVEAEGTPFSTPSLYPVPFAHGAGNYQQAGSGSSSSLANALQLDLCSPAPHSPLPPVISLPHEDTLAPHEPPHGPYSPFAPPMAALSPQSAPHPTIHLPAYTIRRPRSHTDARRTSALPLAVPAREPDGVYTALLAPVASTLFDWHPPVDTVYTSPAGSGTSTTALPAVQSRHSNFSSVPSPSTLLHSPGKPAKHTARTTPRGPRPRNAQVTAAPLRFVPYTHQPSSSPASSQLRCQYCDFVQTNGRVVDLERHTRTHFQEVTPSPVCDRGCGATFSRPDALLRHQANKNLPCRRGSRRQVG